MTSRNTLIRLAVVAVAAGTMLGTVPVYAADAVAVTSAQPVGSLQGLKADDFVKAITADVFAAVRNDKDIQSGDLRKIISVVNSKVIPHIDFQRMTASAVGRGWRQATPEQRTRLQDEFKTLLVYTYAGAAAQIRDQVVEFRPMRSRPEDTEVVVRTLVRGKGDPIQLDYRLEKDGDSWKVYDVNVLGAWLVQTYQSSFAQEINSSGIDGLISKLSERNKQLASRKTAG